MSISQSTLSIRMQPGRVSSAEPQNHPGVFYVYSQEPSVKQKEREFEANKQQNTVVCFYLKTAKECLEEGVQQFYLNLAALNLKDLVNRCRNEKNAKPITENIFYKSDLVSLPFLKTHDVMEALGEVSNWSIGITKDLFQNIEGGKEREHTNNWLYERFTTCCENRQFGQSKIYFYYYICQTDIDLDKIKNAMPKLEAIFRFFETKTYVPQTSDILPLMSGMESLLNIDMTLLAFLHQYQTAPDKTKFNFWGTLSTASAPHQIVDWTLHRPFHPQTQDAKKITLRQKVSSFSPFFTGLDMDITFKNTLYQESGTVHNMTRNEQLETLTAAKVVAEHSFLTTLHSIEGLEQEAQDVERQRENQGEENSLQATQTQESRRATGEEAGQENRQERGDTRSRRQETSQTHHQEIETGTEFSISNKNTNEHGVEIQNKHSHTNEHSKKNASHSETTNQTKTQNSGSGGINLLIFSVGGSDSSEDTTSTTHGTSHETSATHTDTHESGRVEQNKNIQENQQSQSGHAAQRRVEALSSNQGAEDSHEQRQTQAASFLTKKESQDVKGLEERVNALRKRQTDKERENNTKKLSRQQSDQSDQKSIKNIFDHQSSQNTLSFKSEAFSSHHTQSQTQEWTQTCAVKGGHLLITKIDYLRETVITPVRHVAEMRSPQIAQLIQTVGQTSDSLQPLIKRLQNIFNRRFHVTSYDVSSHSLPPTTKYLDLEVTDGPAASHDAINRLNRIYHALDLCVSTHGEVEKNWTQYILHQHTYVEHAGCKYTHQACEALQEMFNAFKLDDIFFHPAFARLYQQLQHLKADLLGETRTGRPFIPNKDSGGLLQHLDADGLVLGEGRLRREDSYKNLLVCGSVGCGKTSTIIIPNLLELKNCSILVTDVDGEIYAKTHQAMGEKGFVVQCLDIQNPSNEKGKIFNPLSNLESTSFEAIKQTIDCIMKAKGFDETKGEKDAFWVIGGKNLLELALEVLMEKNKDQLQKVTLKALFDTVIQMDQAQVQEWAKTSQSVRVKELAQAIQSGGNSFADRAAYAKSAVEYFSAPIITQLTSAMNPTTPSKIDFNTLRTRPTVIYLKIGTPQLHHYNVLLSLFYTQFFSHCMRNSAVTTGQQRLLPIMCLMDEFGHTPIPDFQINITTLRKHHVSVTAIVQSLSQLNDLYGEENAKTLLQGGFTSKLYFALDPSEVEVAQNIVAASGQEIQRMKSFSAGQVSFAEQKADTLQIEKIMYPGLNKATFLHQGFKPIQLELMPYFKNPKYQTLLESQGVSLAPPIVDTVASDTILSKEEAIGRLIQVIKSKHPNMGLETIKNKARKGGLKEYLRQKKVNVDEEPFSSLILQITANRSDLFSNLRYERMTQDNKDAIKAAYERASQSNDLDTCVELIEELLEKGFKLEEVAFLQTQITALLQARPELSKQIETLLIEIFILKGEMSQESIQKTLGDPWGTSPTLCTLIKCLLINAHKDPETKKGLTALCRDRLKELYPTRGAEFERVLTFYSQLTGKSPIQTQLILNNHQPPSFLFIEGKKWGIAHSEHKAHDLVLVLEVSCGSEKKTIKYWANAPSDEEKIRVYIPNGEGA